MYIQGKNLRRALKTSCYSDFCERSSDNAGVKKKKLARYSNNNYNIHWDLGIKTDHQTTIRKPDLVIINKKKENQPKCCENQRKRKKRQILRSCRKTKEIMEH